MAIKLKTRIPGPKSLELLFDRKKSVPTSIFTESPIFIKKAENALVTDVDGNVFIDFAGGVGAMNVGHRNADVIKAAKKQLDAYTHMCFAVAGYEPYVRLAEKLNAITPGNYAKKTAFFNSGAEAVENAVKIARYATKRQAVIAFEHAFHGRTLMAMTLTSKVKPYKFGYEPYAPEVYRMHTPYLYRRPKEMSEQGYIKRCIEDVHSFFETTIAAEETACIVMEPVLGEGGFIVPPVDYVQSLVKFCKKEGILFVADEVQTGFCRTGKMFASEHFGVVPDLICLAKSLSGGFPLSAVTGKAEYMDTPPGELGGTFGGNPVSCSAALAAVDYMEKKKLARRAEQIGKIVAKRFMKLKTLSPYVGDVRGLGAMQGIEFVENKETKEPAKLVTDEIAKKCYERGLLLYTAGTYGNVIRTLAPLTIPFEQLEEGLDVIEEIVLSLK